MIGELLPILLLQGGYNTTIVCIGAAMLGAASGMAGSFALLRKRAMVSDAISHATLPGVCLGFIAALWFIGAGRSLPFILAGAALSAMAGVVLVDLVRRSDRLGEDSAIAVVLSTFYGLGMVLLSYIQTLPTAGQAGLEGMLLGATAGMLRFEAEMIAIAALVLLVVTILLFKELGLVCFDPEFARAGGWPVRLLDLLIMSLVTGVVVIGLKTVGLVLIVALLVIPPAAALYWSRRLAPMVFTAALIAAAGAYVGAAISASAPDLPTGPVIVLTLAALFVFSLLFAPKRGLVVATIALVHHRMTIAERQGLLALATRRSVSQPLSRVLLLRRGWMDAAGNATTGGLSQARLVQRDQALWDRYLLDYPEDAFACREWSMRFIEEVLPGDLVAELDRRTVEASLRTGGV
ncbi:MAG: metal ABC transporter permease [Geminicoccaceae bacterium]